MFVCSCCILGFIKQTLTAVHTQTFGGWGMSVLLELEQQLSNEVPKGGHFQLWRVCIN